LVKLDTNGFYPARLKELVREGLVDYVAMDVKNCMEKYAETVGIANPDLNAVEESVDFLLSGAVDFEFRTTVVLGLHTADDIEKLAKRISGAPRYFLQAFVDSGNIIGSNLSAPSAAQMEEMRAKAVQYVENTQLRGV
jgi:pyruvate-formate lyase-activating enzyme